MRCEIRRSDRPPQGLTLTICGSLTVFHLKNAISAALKVPRERIQLFLRRTKQLLDEKLDHELIRAQYRKEDGFQYLAEVQAAECPREEMPSYAISNFAKAKNYLLKFMNLDEGTAPSRHLI